MLICFFPSPSPFLPPHRRRRPLIQYLTRIPPPPPRIPSPPLPCPPLTKATPFYLQKNELYPLLASPDMQRGFPVPPPVEFTSQFLLGSILPDHNLVESLPQFLVRMTKPLPSSVYHTILPLLILDHKILRLRSLSADSFLSSFPPMPDFRIVINPFPPPHDIDRSLVPPLVMESPRIIDSFFPPHTSLPP